MGDWNLLGSILEEVHIHSTIVGKIWLTILFIFRMLILGAAAEDVIFVSAPSLVYMGHALYCIRALEKERHRKRIQLKEAMDEAELALDEHKRIERELRKLDEQRKVKKAPLRGSLLRTYIIHILTRSVVEVFFILGQYILYGVQLDPLYKCERMPCPNSVDCYISRPTEKTIFMVFMIAIAGVSLFLNILEISHLGIRKIKKALSGERYMEDDSLIFKSKRKVSLSHHCVMSHVSPYNGPLTQTFNVIPEEDIKPPHYPELKTSHETPRNNSIAHPGHIQINCICPQPRIQHQSTHNYVISQSHQGPEVLTTIVDNHHGLESVVSRTEGTASSPHKNTHQREHIEASHLEVLLCNSAIRPSSTDNLEDDLRDSVGSEVLIPKPRKTSFMFRPPSESLSSISHSTSSSLHSSEESDELGSLQGDTLMMPPATGRRMSMSVFLDISSIMKK
ncbi:gap junction protein alpha 10 a isoform X2 [Vanacampus margaritifer]